MSKYKNYESKKLVFPETPEISFNINKENIMNSNKKFFLSIEKYEVERMIFNRVERAIEQLECCKTKGRGRLMITFNGYNDNPHEIYEIEEIKLYIKALFKEHDNLFYFLSDSAYNNMSILACLLDGKKTNGDEKFCNMQLNMGHPLVSKVKNGIFKYKDKLEDTSFESILLFASFVAMSEVYKLGN